MPSPLVLRTTTLTAAVAVLCDPLIERAVAELEARVAAAPDFFRNAPVVIDCSRLEDGDAFDLAAFCGEIRRLGLVPVGLRSGSAGQMAAARSLGLAALPEEIQKPAPPARAAPAEPASSDSPAATATRVVIQPVRSGQRIYAHQSDLVVLAPVSAGAELLADGHIHVYGSLRGRALAGVRGNPECRIFCLDLQAELVAVAGHYQVNEHFPPELMGRPAQIRMDGESLLIEPLLHGGKV